MKMTKKRIALEVALWLVAIFLALVCLRSGLTKLPADSFWARDFRRWHYPGWSRYAVAVAELAACALLLVPRAAVAGAALFAAVMLGAMFTHAAHNEMSRLPFNLLLFALSLVVLFARGSRLLKPRARKLDEVVVADEVDARV
ncbi:MAG: DoxX family protein [Acidobacteria bacterium]|nr:DoxX family protein [Acidobacteriota bacterium]